MQAKGIAKRQRNLPEKARRITETAGMEVRKWGFVQLAPPAMEMPSLPDDFTMLDPEGLGAYYSEFTIWAQYAHQLVTELESDHLVWKEAQRLKKLRLDSQGLKTDAEYEDLSLSKLNVEAKLNHIRGIYKSLTMGHKALSREITRRNLDQSRGNDEQPKRNDGGERHS